MTPNIAINKEVCSNDTFMAMDYNYLNNYLIPGDWLTFWVVNLTIKLFTPLSEIMMSSPHFLIQWFNLICFFISLYYCIGGIAYYIISQRLYGNDVIRQTTKNILVITSHRGDECIFFGPTILKLCRTSNVHLICISKNLCQNKKYIRKKSLWQSCEILGINPSKISLLNAPLLTAPGLFNHRQLYLTIRKAIIKNNIEEVYTFDGSGVDGNLNHCSVYHAIAYMVLSDKVPEYCKFYTLDSVNIGRRYASFMDSTLTIFSSLAYTCTLDDHDIIKNAFAKYMTPTWYQEGLMYFNRYMFVNTYEELTSQNISMPVLIAFYVERDHYPYFLSSGEDNEQSNSDEN